MDMLATIQWTKGKMRLWRLHHPNCNWASFTLLEVTSAHLNQSMEIVRHILAVQKNVRDSNISSGLLVDSQILIPKVSIASGFIDRDLCIQVSIQFWIA